MSLLSKTGINGVVQKPTAFPQLQCRRNGTRTKKTFQRKSNRMIPSAIFRPCREIRSSFKAVDFFALWHPLRRSKTTDKELSPLFWPIGTKTTFLKPKRKQPSICFGTIAANASLRSALPKSKRSLSKSETKHCATLKKPLAGRRKGNVPCGYPCTAAEAPRRK